MQCTNPIYLEFYEMLVPCQKCTACKIARSREWATRIMHEMSYHDNSIFLTLTYDDEHLPKTESISKDELQRFFKRLRKNIGDHKIKYYGAGEYGEKSHRPHYHAIIFNLSNKDQAIIEKSWQLGTIFIGTLTYDSARYVTDYIQKNHRKLERTDNLAPFQISSQGLGKQFALDNREQLTENLGCTINGKKMGLPKYYRKILEIPTELLFEKAKEAEKHTLEVHKKRTRNNSKNDAMTKSIKVSRKQHNYNVQARTAMKQKGKI